MNRNPQSIATTPSSRIEIGHSGVACIEDGRGAEILVELGCVWITQDRSIEDVCLNAGESFRIARNGLTIVTAVGRHSSAIVAVRPAGGEFASPRGHLQAAWRALFRPAASEGLRVAF
jgi:hypothetical protein